MKERIIKQLLNINEEFYQTFADSFSRTRQRVQPGIKKVLNEIPLLGNWVDLGCSNGGLAIEWARQHKQGLYFGLDSSAGLLDLARKKISEVKLPDNLKVSFQQNDIARSNWVTSLPGIAWDGVLAFAVLHHIPDAGLRLQILKQIYKLLPQGGKFYFSVWQFQKSPQLMTHCVDWSQAGIFAQDVEPGDYLLDWRAETTPSNHGVGLRYVHLYEKKEFEDLSICSGFKKVMDFESDGRTGNLSLYQLWIVK
jgi:tRNA (uracil-5-)-methyltransferase TRM9